MSDNVIQASFSAGELSPSLFARVDFAKYRSGAARMRNFFVDYRSGASTRPGTEFIRPAVLDTKKVRLVRFQQSTKVTYVLEFGWGYLRFISNGSSIVGPQWNIASIGVGSATVINTNVAGWTAGHLVFITGSGIPQLDNRYFIIQNPSGNSFNILDSVTGLNIDSIAWPPYVSGRCLHQFYRI